MKQELNTDAGNENNTSASENTNALSVALPAAVLENLSTQSTASTQTAVSTDTPVVNERMLQQAKIIFARLLNFNEDTPTERIRVKTEFGNVNPFIDEFAVLFDIVTANNKVDIDVEFVQIYLLGNQFRVERNANINLKKYAVGTDDVYAAFSISLCDLVKELLNLEVTETAFETALAKFKMLYVTEQSITLLETGVEVLVDSKRIGNKTYGGYEGMRNYLSDGFNALDKVVEQKRTKGAICYGVTPEHDESENMPQPLGTLGLPGIDDYYTVYEGDMINLLGAPKAGKTRATIQIINHMCVDNGVNCLIWSLENSPLQWEHAFRVKEFNRVYNKTVGSVVQKKIITEKQLREKTMSAEIHDLELASWTSFKHNPEFGRLVSIDEALNYDTFLEILDANVKKYNVKFICIDYLGVMDPGKTGPREATPLLADVYKKMKQYLRNNRIAGVFPMHMKQQDLQRYSTMSNAELAEADLRDAAGVSNEVIKTPDVNMAIVASKSQIAVGYERLVPILSRVVDFPLTEMHVDLPTSTFIAKK